MPMLLLKQPSICICRLPPATTLRSSCARKALECVCENVCVYVCVCVCIAEGQEGGPGQGKQGLDEGYTCVSKGWMRVTHVHVQSRDLSHVLSRDLSQRIISYHSYNLIKFN
jgi:hypothetical protein